MQTPFPVCVVNCPDFFGTLQTVSFRGVYSASGNARGADRKIAARRSEVAPAKLLHDAIKGRPAGSEWSHQEQMAFEATDEEFAIRARCVYM